jgi:putative colanic acid biosynthesis UDP-glucose lipid carrier transferase
MGVPSDRVGTTTTWRPPQGLSIKHGFDRLFALLLLLAMAPLFLGLVAAVRLSSPGPAFYRQTRHGRDRQPFDIWKFRSMYVADCDDRRSTVIRQAIQGDPRVTPVGRILRRTSLDELPQLFNVLRGEMSFVGPRPHAIAEDEHYGAIVARYDDRFRMRPGITGLAQVRGLRGEILSDDFMCRRIAADNAYIDRWSLGLDLWIVLQTLLVVFRREQTY